MKLSNRGKAWLVTVGASVTLVSLIAYAVTCVVVRVMA